MSVCVCACVRVCVCVCVCVCACVHACTCARVWWVGGDQGEGMVCLRVRMYVWGGWCVEACAGSGGHCDCLYFTCLLPPTPCTF